MKPLYIKKWEKERLVKVIIYLYGAKEIYLSGSYSSFSKKQPNDNSDIDVYIVKGYDIRSAQKELRMQRYKDLLKAFIGKEVNVVPVPNCIKKAVVVQMERLY